MRHWHLAAWLALLIGVLAGCGGTATVASSGGTSAAAPAAAGQGACGGVSASATPERSFSGPPPMQIDPKKNYTATIETKFGNIVIQLLPQDAPTTVNNFVFLACHHFYDGLTFHRIVPDFVIQGGDPQGTGAGGPGYQFRDELPKSSSVYTAGAVAMANAGPNTNCSQFFICIADDSAKLQPLYSYFGKVAQGMDVVAKIAAVPLQAGPSGEASQPVTPVVMQHVTIQEQ